MSAAATIAMHTLGRCEPDVAVQQTMEGCARIFRQVSEHMDAQWIRFAERGAAAAVAAAAAAAPVAAAPVAAMQPRQECSPEEEEP